MSCGNSLEKILISVAAGCRIETYGQFNTVVYSVKLSILTKPSVTYRGVKTRIFLKTHNLSQYPRCPSNVLVLISRRLLSSHVYKIRILFV